jgi:pyridoxine/pyridoxamine 5'-phosphate oxidase
MSELHELAKKMREEWNKYLQNNGFMPTPAFWETLETLLQKIEVVEQ